MPNSRHSSFAARMSPGRSTIISETVFSIFIKMLARCLRR
jgi:hypothetical protein